MKRKKRNSENAPSPFWKPTKKGEELSGKFGGFEKTDKAVCMKVGNNLVSMSTVLVGFFKPVFKKLRLDKTEIRLRFIGLTDKKYAGGNRAKLFQVFMDEEELFSEFKGEKATDEDLAKLFG